MANSRYRSSEQSHENHEGIVTQCKGIMSSIGLFIWRCLCSSSGSEANGTLGRSDMKLFQEEADRKRVVAFGDVLKSREKIVRRRKYRGAPLSFQLASRTIHRTYGCGACGTLLFRPSEICDGKIFDVELSDSETVVSLKDCANVRYGPIRCKSDMSETWKYDVQTIRCSNCNVYLGLYVSKIANLTSWMEISSHGWCERMGAPILRTANFRRGSVISGGSNEIPVGGIETRQIFIGHRYIRALRSDGTDVPKRIKLTCKGCTNVLSYTDQILCTRRRWGFGDGPNEPACYMNSLAKAI
uniref:Yippee domain-containing protein n=1 Tax=Lotharella globosa TaxID=91324 RepID=A0A6U2YKR7_9EUKA|mmetsp:Transcript_17035/g.33257  ORF Transcript_17035/g.33257 Transcript_17035/m.33257 type:complete len:299 (+) Transcript_17035:61-957(+)